MSTGDERPPDVKFILCTPPEQIKSIDCLVVWHFSLKKKEAFFKTFDDELLTGETENSFILWSWKRVYSSFPSMYYEDTYRAERAFYKLFYECVAELMVEKVFDEVITLVILLYFLIFLGILHNCVGILHIFLRCVMGVLTEEGLYGRCNLLNV